MRRRLCPRLHRSCPPQLETGSPASAPSSGPGSFRRVVPFHPPTHLRAGHAQPSSGWHPTVCARPPHRGQRSHRRVPPCAVGQGCWTMRTSTRCPSCSSCTVERLRKRWGVKRPRRPAMDTRTRSSRYHTCRRGRRGREAEPVRSVAIIPLPLRGRAARPPRPARCAGRPGVPHVARPSAS